MYGSVCFGIIHLTLTHVHVDVFVWLIRKTFVNIQGEDEQLNFSSKLPGLTSNYKHLSQQMVSIQCKCNWVYIISNYWGIAYLISQNLNK